MIVWKINPLQSVIRIINESGTKTQKQKCFCLVKRNLTYITFWCFERKGAFSVMQGPSQNHIMGHISILLERSFQPKEFRQITISQTKTIVYILQQQDCVDSLCVHISDNHPLFQSVFLYVIVKENVSFQIYSLNSTLSNSNFILGI